MTYVRSKKILLIIVIILLLGVAFWYLVSTRQSTVRPKVAGVSYSLSPASATKQVGDNLDLSVTLNSGTNNVSFVDFTLNYDQSILEVSSFTTVSALNTVIVNQPDNKTGKFRFVAGNNSNNPVRGNINVGTVHFRVKGAGNAKVNLVSNEVTVRTNPPSDVNVSVASGTYLLKNK